MDIQKIKMDYYDNLSLYKRLEEEAVHIINEEIKENEIKIHSILSRVKDSESFLQKVERKRYKDPFNETTDLVGVRVVCLFLSDLKRIEQLIKANFDLKQEENKVNENQIEFGYMSYHYIVTLKDEYTGHRYDRIKGIPFEIQVRTISMDAWANISHYLDYKTDNDIPAELKKDFNAISGLFYVADTHFELFYKETQENKREIEHKITDILTDNSSETEEEINLDSLNIYLRKKFPERLHSSESGVSELVNELRTYGYNTINKLDKLIKSGLNAALEYENQNKPSGGGNYQDVGIIRMLLAIMDEQYRGNKYTDDHSYEKYRNLID